MLPCVYSEVGLSEKKINVKLFHSMVTNNSRKFVPQILLAWYHRVVQLIGANGALYNQSHLTLPFLAQDLLSISDLTCTPFSSSLRPAPYVATCHDARTMTVECKIDAASTLQPGFVELC